MKKAITILFTLSLLFISYRSFTNAGGPPAGNTGAPGNTTCGQSVCHNSTPIISGADWNNISLAVTTPGVTLSTLQPNTTYSFNLTVVHSTSSKIGFQLIVLPSGSSTTSASLGTLILGSGTQIFTNGTRSYLEHSTPSTSSSKTWSFQWTTPASPSATTNAVFYVAVNATNNSSTPDAGDKIYTKTFASTVLPVEWLYAKARRNNDDVMITWATATEKNSWKFVVEKSLNKTDWTAIGEVEGKGNSALVNKYSFVEKDVRETALYRIKQIDFNGKYSYSSLMEVKGEQLNNKPKVVYNVDKMLYVIKGDEPSRISIINMAGEVKYSQTEMMHEQEIPKLPNGLYVVAINTATETIYHKILMQ